MVLGEAETDVAGVELLQEGAEVLGEVLCVADPAVLEGGGLQEQLALAQHFPAQVLLGRSDLALRVLAELRHQPPVLLLVLLVPAPPRPAQQQAADRPLAALRRPHELLPQLAGDAGPGAVGVAALLDPDAPLERRGEVLLEVMERGRLFPGAGRLFGGAAAVAGLFRPAGTVWLGFGDFCGRGLALNKRRRAQREILSDQLVFPVVLAVTVVDCRAALFRQAPVFLICIFSHFYSPR